MGLVTTLPRGRGFTRDDLVETPDDGCRYELIDGVLLVSPAPSFRHQRVSVNLTVLLHQACPPSMLVMHAPFAVGLAGDTEVQPDLLVARRADFTARDLPTAPLLAVEILSPSTRLVDLTLKRARYEQAGCPSYWVIDPLATRLTAWELRDGGYVEVADTTEVWTAELPYAVTVVPADLVR